VNAPTSLPFATLVVAALALPGCVPQGEFPSLEPRPAERDRSMEPPVREAAVTPSDPALRLRVSELEQQAARGQSDFDGAYARAEAAVRSAGSAESESWVEAQQAISRLEAARTETMRALTELDRLAIDQADMPTSNSDFAAIQAAIAAAQQLAEGQQARIEALRARLRD
jgi:hypothetical protein